MHNYNDNVTKQYANNFSTSNHIYCIILFNKAKNIYLIAGHSNKVKVLDFVTTNLIKEIEIKGYCIDSLCPIKEKYIIIGQSKFKVIDIGTYSVVKEYEHNGDWTPRGIEKIKIP